MFPPPTRLRGSKGKRRRSASSEPPRRRAGFPCAAKGREEGPPGAPLAGTRSQPTRRGARTWIRPA